MKKKQTEMKRLKPSNAASNAKNSRLAAASTSTSSNNDNKVLKSKRGLRKSVSFDQKGQSQPTIPKTSSSHSRREFMRKSVSFNDVVRTRPTPTNYNGASEKNVSFDEVVMVRPVLPLDMYTDNEIADCWYFPTDKKRFSQEILHTLKKVKARESLEGCTVRGLEKYSQMGKSQEERRKFSIKVVLEEQETQRALVNGDSSLVYDTTKMRKAYRKLSKSAQNLANAIGKLDEMEASSQKAAVRPQTGSILKVKTAPQLSQQSTPPRARRASSQRQFNTRI
jgi:hypothetical protein